LTSTPNDRRLPNKFDLVLNTGDTLRAFALLETTSNAIQNALSVASQAVRYYTEALDLSGLIPYRRVLATHRAAYGLILKAQLSQRVIGEGGGVEAKAMLALARQILESLSYADYRIANMARSTPTDVVIIKTLMTELSIDPKAKEIRRQAEDKIRGVLERTGDNPTPYRMIVELFRDILAEPEEGLRFLDAVLASRVAKPIFVLIAKEKLEVSLFNRGHTVGRPGGVEAAIVALAKHPKSWDVFNGVLEAYLIDDVIPTDIDVLFSKIDIQYPNLIDLIRAIFCVDGHGVFEPSTPLGYLFLSLLLEKDGPANVMGIEFGKDVRFAIESLSRFYFDRGRRQQNGSDLKRCGELLRFGLSHSPDGYWSGRLAAVLRLQGNLLEALTIVDDALKYNKTDSVLLLEKAKITVQMKDFDLASKILENVISGARGNIHPAINGFLAFVSFERGLRDRSAKIWRSLLRSNEADWRAAFGLAQVIVQEKEDRREAVGLWIRCTNLQADEGSEFGEIVAWRAACSAVAQLRKGAEILWPGEYFV